MNREYDAVVVGARCAGSATALLMARAGLRVLLLDRVHPGRDTLSTHALMRAGVLQLDRWGLLDRVVAAGTPAITGTTFHYADGADHVALAAPLYAPRRTVLDPILLDAALETGVEARFGVDVSAVTRADTGRVTGVRFAMRGGPQEAVRAALTVGADGLRSGIARAVEARPTFEGAAASALVFGYWPVERLDDYDWYYRPGAAAGVIPTNPSAGGSARSARSGRGGENAAPCPKRTSRSSASIAVFSRSMSEAMSWMPLRVRYLARSCG